jgi:hypothetical protein
LAPLKIPQPRLSHFQQLVPSLLSLVPGMPFRILLFWWQQMAGQRPNQIAGHLGIPANLKKKPPEPSEYPLVN